MNLKQWFDSHLQDVVFDAKLARAISHYRIAYLTASQGHMAFYGEALIGTHDIWFKTSYENLLFDKILKIDKAKMQLELHEVDGSGNSILVPSIVPGRKVSSDIYNLLLLYIAHRFLLADIPKPDAINAAKVAMSLYCYRTLAAVHSNSFRFLGSQDIARATYERLSNKFILKQLKSWKAYINYRVESMYGKADIFNPVLLSFDNDAAILFMLTNASTLIRDTFKTMYQLYLNIRDSQQYGASTTLMTDFGSETDIQDVINAESKVQAIGLMVADGSFIKRTVMSVTQGLMPRVAEAELLHMLRIIHQNYISNQRLISSFILDVVSYTAEILRLANADIRRDPAILVQHLYTQFGSSKTRHVVLDRVRDTGYTILRKLDVKDGEASTIKMRNALILYIAILTATH